MTGSVIPQVPEGSPPWLYVIAVAAAVLVIGIGAAPTIIEKLRGTRPAPRPDTPPPATSPTSPPPAGEPERAAPTDTLRGMIADLQARLDRSETREDDLQRQLLAVSRDLATAEAQIAHQRTEIGQLRTQVQILSTRREYG